MCIRDSLRYNEFEQVLTTYKNLGLDVKGIDARNQFYSALKGVSDPETKRKIIGRIFIDVFQEAAKSFPEVKWLCQGTIYPDIIESVSVYGPSVTIKSHHNVCLLYTSPSPRDRTRYRMPSSA